MLAGNAATLRAQSLYYPRGGDFQAAENFEISAGNFRFKDIKSNPARFEAITREGGSIVLSSEYFFHEIAASVEPLLFFKDRGFEVHVLVFTRNPVAQIMSGYSQAVKREGYCGTIDQFVAGRNYRIQHPFELAPFIEHCDAAGAKLTLANYDRNRDRLFNILFAFLEIDATGIEVPERLVNRSQSRAELEIVRVMGELFGSTVSQSISDSLCNDLPGIRSELIFPTAEVLTTFVNNVRPVIQELEDIYHGRIEPYDIDFVGAICEAESQHFQQISMPSDDQARIIRQHLVAGIAVSDFAALRFRHLKRRFQRGIGRRIAWPKRNIKDDERK